MIIQNDQDDADKRNNNTRLSWRQSLTNLITGPWVSSAPASATTSSPSSATTSGPSHTSHSSGNGRRSTWSPEVPGGYGVRNQQSSPTHYVTSPTGLHPVTEDPDDIHDSRDPPPPYTPRDQNQVPFNRRQQYSGAVPRQPSLNEWNQAQPRQQRASHYSTREPQARYTMPAPQATNGDSSGPPPNIQPTNNVSIQRNNASIHGYYIIDPGKSGGSRWGRKNLDLTACNGSVDVDVAIVPTPAGSSAAHDYVHMDVTSTCGTVRLRLHDPPARFLLDESENAVQRPVLLRADGTNGNVHICIPRSFEGFINASSGNGKVSLSEALSAKMTSLNDVSNVATTEIKGFVGDFDGLTALVAALDEEAANAANNEEHGAPRDEGENVLYIGSDGPVSFSSGSNFTRMVIPDGTTVYGNPFGGGGMFSNVSNMSINGGMFTNVNGNMHTTSINSRTGGRSTTEIRTSGPPRGRSSDSPATKAFEDSWEGHRVVARSVNGNVKIAFDDEHAFGSYGGWKQNNEDAPRRSQTVNLPNVSIISFGGSSWI